MNRYINFVNDYLSTALARFNCVSIARVVYSDYFHCNVVEVFRCDGQQFHISARHDNYFVVIALGVKYTKTHIEAVDVKNLIEAVEIIPKVEF